jgi:hypothetical protein
LAFEVVVHDPAEVGLNAIPVGISVLKMNNGAQGVLPIAGTGGTASTGATGGGTGGSVPGQ